MRRGLVRSHFRIVLSRPSFLPCGDPPSGQAVHFPFAFLPIDLRTRTGGAWIASSVFCSSGAAAFGGIGFCARRRKGMVIGGEALWGDGTLDVLSEICPAVENRIALPECFDLLRGRDVSFLKIVISLQPACHRDNLCPLVFGDGSKPEPDRYGQLAACDHGILSLMPQCERQGKPDVFKRDLACKSGFRHTHRGDIGSRLKTEETTNG